MTDIIKCCVCDGHIRSGESAGTNQGKYYCGVHIHKMTDPHDSEVRRIAEILAKVDWANSHKLRNWESLQDLTKDNFVKEQLPAARVMVAEMASQYEAGYEQAAKDYGYSIAHSDPDIKAYQIERGLIPSQIKTGEK